MVSVATLDSKDARIQELEKLLRFRLQVISYIVEMFFEIPSQFYSR